MKILELKGYRSLRALNAFHTLLLGLKMLPAHIGKAYESFYSDFAGLSELEQDAMIREAALFVELSKDEVEALAAFAADDNGVPFESANLKNLSPDKILEIIVTVCKEIGKIKIDIVTDAEKKNFLTSR